MSQEFPNKLFNYAVSPPPFNWEAIVSALDDQTSVAAAKLQAFESIPPARIWNDVAQALDSETREVPQARVTPGRFSRPLRIVAAAAILLLITGLITVYVNRGGTTTEVARQPAPGLKEQPLRSPDIGTAVPEASSKETGDVAIPLAATSAASKVNRYVVMAKEDGHKVRLSKKALAVFDCAENSAPQNKERCKENIQLMQQKMAASMLSPAGDFGGLIDMIRSLEEND